MKFKISAKQIKARYRDLRSKGLAQPPRLLVTETLEPGLYSIVSDIDKLHSDKCVYYRVVRKIDD